MYGVGCQFWSSPGTSHLCCSVHSYLARGRTSFQAHVFWYWYWTPLSFAVTCNICCQALVSHLCRAVYTPTYLGENQFSSSCVQLQRASSPGSPTPPSKSGQKTDNVSVLSSQTKCQEPATEVHIGSERMGENETESFSMSNHGVVGEESTDGIFSNRTTMRPSQPGLGQLFNGASW